MDMWWSRCSAKPRNADRYYATQAEYEAAWRERRQTLFDRYLHATLYGDNGAMFASSQSLTDAHTAPDAMEQRCGDESAKLWEPS